MLRNVSCLALILLGCQTASGGERPNVVFFLVDDLGWSDLGCYGSTLHETPHIDELCESGVKFTQAYSAASICSPTRASLMSGKHPVRVNITDWIPGARAPKWAVLQTPQDQHQLDLEEVTFAEAMKEAGYRTYYAGKWHLGDEGFGPTEQGFDAYLEPEAWKEKRKKKKERRFERPHGTREITAGALEFLDKHATGDAPLLLYLSYNDVHTPIVADKRRLAYFEKKIADLPTDNQPPIADRRSQTRRRQDNAEYATMVDAVDQSVGQVLAALDEKGLAGETIVIFFSDNGGLSARARVGPTSNAPLRSGKGWLYEGGIRVPLIIRAPGVTAAGAVCRTPVVSMDLYPTMLELTSCPPRPKQHIDAVSVAQLLRGTEPEEPRPLYWHYPHYHGSTWAPGGAIRHGDFKLIEFFETGEAELYNLAEDLGETDNLAESLPEVTQELRTKLQAWRELIGAAMPVHKDLHTDREAG